jgi:uncharacterized protein (UPF0335 family)
MSKAEELAATLNAYERSGIWYTSSDAANELRRLQAEVERLTAENAELRKNMEKQKDTWLSWEGKRRDLEKDAERWQQIAYMESSRVAPEILADYIAKPERLDYAAELRKHHDKAMKETS